MKFPEMYRIVCSMISRKECLAFREPVDWKGMDLPDYPELIKKPMDLGTVKKKIESEMYNSMKEIADDIRLVFYNCMLYNKDGSEFYHLADKFSMAFEDVYKTLIPGDDESQEKDRLPTVDEKILFSYELFRVGNIELARSLTIIEAACPDALQRSHGGDEVTVAVDGLTPQCFHEVMSYIHESRKKGSRKRETNQGAPASSKKAALAHEDVPLDS
mmetsp:Transcript_10754/g.14813  ORF Transcript_10754/g.14813 Transcript_10754/m.14813 type:complete len:216 (-) Transcript_10754:172-819(-)